MSLRAAAFRPACRIPGSPFVASVRPATAGGTRSENMKIYWIKAQAPRRVLALAKHLGLEVDFVQVDMLAGG